MGGLLKCISKKFGLRVWIGFVWEQWWAFVNTAMYIRVPYRRGFLDQLSTITFSKITLLHRTG
jgi:hypothetical protein